MATFPITPTPATGGTLNAASGPTSESLTFAIPAGYIWSNAELDMVGTSVGLNGVIHSNFVTAGDTLVLLGSGNSFNWISDQNVTATQLAEIQSASGGNLTARYALNGANTAGISQRGTTTLILTGELRPPGAASVSVKKDYSRHTRHVHQFFNVAFTGYKPGININDYGGLVTVFASVKVPGWNRARLVNDVLQIYDSAGIELADGADCPSPVSIWRIGF